MFEIPSDCCTVVAEQMTFKTGTGQAQVHQVPAQVALGLRGLSPWIYKAYFLELYDGYF